MYPMSGSLSVSGSKLGIWHKVNCRTAPLTPKMPIVYIRSMEYHVRWEKYKLGSRESLLG